ncbi:MAG: class II aldolase/adducin family protein [Polyangiaceae bacterium]|nr:class II aldolase/adducin family protein [Polyangiaceae bacterium]
MAKSQPDDLAAYVDQAKRDAIFAYGFLRETGTLTASHIGFNVAHKVPELDKLVTVSFPPPWSRDREPKATVTDFSSQPDHILNELRLDADTVMHAHTPYLAAWSLAQKPFPILYVAPQRQLLSREIPNHLERRRSPLDVIRERLDKYPELAPPPGLLESNGGANIWSRGILKTAELVLLIEEGARIQAIAEQIGGAKEYTEGALEVQWARTGLVEKAKAYSRAFAPAAE